MSCSATLPAGPTGGAAVRRCRAQATAWRCRGAHSADEHSPTVRISRTRGFCGATIPIGEAGEAALDSDSHEAVGIAIAALVTRRRVLAEGAGRSGRTGAILTREFITKPIRALRIRVVRTAG